MKASLRLILTAISLMLVFNIFAAVETTAQNILPEILKRMETNRNNLQSLRSGVMMVKYDSVLKVPDTTLGTAIYVPLKGRDALVRIDWKKPDETLTVANGTYTLYRPRLKQAIIGNAKKAKGKGTASNALSFINMSKAELKANFTIKYLGEETVNGDTQTWHLELTPKTAQSYKSAELWVDSNGMPIQAKVIENNNDTTTVLLSNLEKNVAVNTKVFILVLPDDVKKIKG